jgi:imidazolonepropionase-like amidohydrolase
MNATGRTLFTNVRVFDGTGGARFDGQVLVEDGRIATLSRGSEALSADAHRIDGGGATLMPGMVECHAHITYPNAVDRFYPHLYPPAAVETTLMTVHNAQVLLDHGFTSAYSAGAIKPGIETKLREEIEAGRITGPRLRTASMEVYFPGDPDARPMPQTNDELVAFVRESKDEGVDIIKLFLSGLDNVLEQDDWEMVLSDEAVALTAREATQQGMWLSCHVRPVAGLKQALRNGFRVLYHVEEVDDEALDLMEQRKNEIFVGPTIGGIALRAEMANGETRENAKRRLVAYKETIDRIRSRGVRVVPFGDYGFPGRPHGHNARDLGYFVRYLGFTPAEALAAATKWGGEMMGRDRFGLVEPGYVADLLLVDGDPTNDVGVLEDPTRLLTIMQAGAAHKSVAPGIRSLADSHR